MYKRRMIKAAMTAATIAVAVALPVSTASAATASAATASPQVHTWVPEGLYPSLSSCVAAGYGLTLTAGASYYECEPALFAGSYILYAAFD